MTTPISKLYKTIVLIAIVVAPIYWLMVTDDGKRRTDTLILWISGGDPIDINFKVLDNRYTNDEWKEVFPDIPWKCNAQVSTWGDETCFSKISSYNGIPAYYISVFFADGYCSGLKLVYRNQYHKELGLELQRQMGKASVSGAVPDSVLKWQTDYGIVLLKQQLGSGDEEAALLWLPKS